MTQLRPFRSSPTAIFMLAAFLAASGCDQKAQSDPLPPAKGPEAPSKPPSKSGEQPGPSPANPTPASPTSASPAPATPTTAAANQTVRANVNPSQRFVGNLEARERIDVAAKSTGILLDVAVKEGDDVEKGKVLFRQQDTHARLAVEQANTAIAQAQVQLAHSERELARAKDLAERGSAALAKVDLATYGRDAAQAALKQAQAGLDLARFQVSEAVVRAPIDGTVTHRLQDPGELATMMPPTVVLVLQDLKILKAKIRVPVHVLSRAKIGDQLDVLVNDLNVKRVGKLVRIADVVDPMTRTAELEVHVDNGDRLLKPGMYVEATLGAQVDAAATRATTEQNPPLAKQAAKTAKEKP